jgi:hypothetical protein
MEQSRQAAASLDFCSCPSLIVEGEIGGRKVKVLEVERPDDFSFFLGGQVQEEDAVEALHPERVLIMPDGVEDHWSTEYQELIELS